MFNMIRRRWVDNIMMDLGEVGWGDVDWIGLAKDRNRWRALVNSVLYGPRSRPTTFFSDSAGNGARASGSLARNSDH
jgi:hypothetical protein